MAYPKRVGLHYEERSNERRPDVSQTTTVPPGATAERLTPQRLQELIQISQSHLVGVNQLLEDR